MATNCLGPYLLTQLLLPILVETAKSSTSAHTRVLWTSSIATDMGSPKGGILLEQLAKPPAGQQLNYSISKTGNWFLADALAKQVGRDGILSVTLNPGHLRSNLTRHMPSWVPILAAPLLHKPKMGAYTNIWAALSPELTIEDGGKYILPWGRVHPSPRKDIVDAMKTKEQGGTGEATVFVDYCKRRTAEFA
nr:putative oxidoreductase [Quercus suber]